MDDGPARFTRISALVEGEAPAQGDLGGRAGALGRLCTVLVREVGAVGAGLTVLVDNAPPLVVATSGRDAEELEELQLVLGEGPCVDAVTARRPVFETDLGVRGFVRWPAYAPAARALDVGAVFAFPLQVGGACAGVLDVHRTRPGSLSTGEVLEALTFADLALSILLDDQQDATERRPWEDLDGSMTPAELYQAQGMVMVQLGISLGEAMVRIRAHAYAQDQRLGDVARAITGGTLFLARDDNGDGTSPVS
ncbi:GAF and ANTAR domain-containing protein [Ornithinimicrobium sediminis]|uniref:GAF and ANTAR domain-containing protein n=1 Tax=Ornithinimicrobium sediminis TaxID=2904603 RepID=UPI001E456154|nr:GAF and ANTAR domain-containing protein [Ornithinimicrobium sediminis]MCE0487236.1 GAF and ANTAR domain-containing protein [Ornithinimicrobium sediminis]